MSPDDIVSLTELGQTAAELREARRRWRMMVAYLKAAAVHAAKVKTAEKKPRKVWAYDDAARAAARVRYQRRRARLHAAGLTVHGLQREKRRPAPAR